MFVSLSEWDAFFIIIGKIYSFKENVTRNGFIEL